MHKLTAGFCFGRYLLKDWVETFVRGKWKKWEYIDKAIELEGWKLVLIMRFSPLIPYNILNIAMATTSMPFWQVGDAPQSKGFVASDENCISFKILMGTTRF